jgi:hypothetical protein
MIPLLIWRCPICTTNDSLVEKRSLFRHLRLHCKACNTIWCERREVGVDSWLSVTESPSYPDLVGVELKSRDWYAKMKDSITLTPLDESAIALDEDEVLYLISRNADLTATADNPYFFEPDPELTLSDLRKTSGKVGKGRVLLTNQRLIWEGIDGRTVALPLTKLNSVYALRNKNLILLYELHMLSLRFSEESLLKWLTYFSKVGEGFKHISGHTITTSRF